MSQNRLYDQVFLIAPEKDEQAAAGVVDHFRKMLVELGAQLEKDETMGRRRLAYEIKKRTEATYHNFLFRSDSKAVLEVERRMRLSDDVLRFLTVRVDEEMRHGQKVVRRTKVRPARRPDAVPGAAVAPAAPAAPAATPVPETPAAPTEGGAPAGR